MIQTLDALFDGAALLPEVRLNLPLVFHVILNP
jgi:hypothetical protein